MEAVLRTVERLSKWMQAVSGVALCFICFSRCVTSVSGFLTIPSSEPTKWSRRAVVIGFAIPSHHGCAVISSSISFTRSVRGDAERPERHYKADMLGSISS